MEQCYYSEQDARIRQVKLMVGHLRHQHTTKNHHYLKLPDYKSTMATKKKKTFPDLNSP